MNPSWTVVRLPSSDESIAPVTILDTQGRLVRVVSAEEFRRDRLAATADMLTQGRSVPMRTRRALRRAHTEGRPVSFAAGAPRGAIAS